MTLRISSLATHRSRMVRLVQPRASRVGYRGRAVPGYLVAVSPAHGPKVPEPAPALRSRDARLAESRIPACRSGDVWAPQGAGISASSLDPGY